MQLALRNTEGIHAACLIIAHPQSKRRLRWEWALRSCFFFKVVALLAVVRINSNARPFRSIMPLESGLGSCLLSQVDQS